MGEGIQVHTSSNHSQNRAQKLMGRTNFTIYGQLLKCSTTTCLAVLSVVREMNFLEQCPLLSNHNETTQTGHVVITFMYTSSRSCFNVRHQEQLIQVSGLTVFFHFRCTMQYLPEQVQLSES
jgi:hypothetical protein